MGEEQFTAMMSYISNDMVAFLSAKQGISPQAAIEAFYASHLYELLEKEDTKLWHYSTEMLYSLFLQEQKTGSIIFPDV